MFASLSAVRLTELSIPDIITSAPSSKHITMSRSGRRSGENSYEKAVEELNSFAVVPQLVLFNPEGVFWESNSGADVVPYPEVPGILSALRFKGVRIGVVAHTQQPYLTSTALSRLTHESFSPMVRHLCCMVLLLSSVGGTIDACCGTIRALAVMSQFLTPSLLGVRRSAEASPQVRHGLHGNVRYSSSSMTDFWPADLLWAGGRDCERPPGG